MTLLDKVQVGSERATLGASLHKRVQEVGKVQLGSMRADTTLSAEVSKKRTKVADDRWHPVGDDQVRILALESRVRHLQ